MAEAEVGDDFDIPDSPQVSAADGTAGPPTGDAAGSGPTDTGAPQAPATAAAPATDAGPWPDYLSRAFRDEKLGHIPGETPAAAQERLTSHLRGKNREFRTQTQATQQELAQIRQAVQLWEPMLRDYYHRQRAAAQEEQLAQIPDPVEDPTGYQTYLLEENLRVAEERRLSEAQSIEEAQRIQAEQARAAELRAVDEQGYGMIAQGLGLNGGEADPEFVVAYDTLSKLGLQSAADYFPDASPQQIQEFVGLSQLLDVRRMTAAGLDIREVMKGRVNGLIDSLVQLGVVTRAQAKAAMAMADVAASGNGQTRPAVPTAQSRVAADAVAAARRSPLAVPSGGRPAGAPGELPDASAMDEDDFVEAALSGMLGSAEQRIEKHRRQR